MNTTISDFRATKSGFDFDGASKGGRNHATLLNSISASNQPRRLSDRKNTMQVIGSKFEIEGKTMPTSPRDQSP